ncbi:MAG TPA: sigma-70 family RNA polymerase sigma factor [Planctomycetota bacterium]
MHLPSDEDLFASFQRQRDCQALAVLFRRRADELLRLAVFLAPRPTDAEDLVQATFLSAIARAETFRAEHRVMSWLCGILTNHARMLRRAAQRVLPHLRTNATDDDPAAAALHSELRNALAQGIQSLPEPYRSVLTLHLKDGLDSQEISRRLARPPATVRKQMERAIARLRVVLPLGLATALVVRMSPAQIAQNAAEAARFVDLGPLEATPSSGMHAGTLAALAATAFVLAFTVLWATTNGEHVEVTAAAAAPLGVGSAAKEPADADAAFAAPGAANTASAERTAAESLSLTVHVAGRDAATRPGVELLLVPDDGRALPERLQSGAFTAARTDLDGRAEYRGLAAGRYDVAIAGALARKTAMLREPHTELHIELPASQRVRGLVVDADGTAVEGADVFLSETSGRGDTGTRIATSRADGSFAGTAPVAQGRLYARHGAHAQSVGVRLADHPMRLQLELSRRKVAITTVDEAGKPLPDCYVAIVPRSHGTSFYAPMHASTDAAGRCTFQDPGPGEASVLASRAGFAPSTADLPPGASAIEFRLGAGGSLSGQALDADGLPMAGCSVVASVADRRSNEPTAPLLARRAQTLADGSFEFRALPFGDLQVRIYAESFGDGKLPCQYVLASADVELRSGAQEHVTLRAHRQARVQGRVQDAGGTGLRGWQIVAVPDLGTAIHRMFRRRAATTAADGSFTLDGVTAHENYQLGAYPPDSRWPDGLEFPVATAAATAGAPCTVTIPATAQPSARLRCRVLAPNGQPCTEADVELRPVAFQAPVTRAVAADGTATFDNLAAGDYWLAVSAPGLGTRTLAVAVTKDGEVDAGTVQLALATRAVVRVQARDGARSEGLRVVAQNTLGDKFVSAPTDARGQAQLPPLPPGETRLLVYGPGAAPVRRTVVLEPGPQWIDVELARAVTVPIEFRFTTADNPFVVNGPLHVCVFASSGELLFEDYVGAVAARGRFDFAAGLAPARYRIVARAIWGAQANVDLEVGPAVAQATQVAALRF